MAGDTSLSANNSIETDSHNRSSQNGVIDTLKEELVRKTMRQTWEQFFKSLDKSEKQSTHGDMQNGGEIVFFSKPQESQMQEKPLEVIRRPEVRAAMNYGADILHPGERERHQENREIVYRMQEIQVEIQQLVASYQTLEITFKDVVIAQTPRNVGKYHINFLDFVLKLLQDTRKQIDDSGAWLGTMKGKMGYWDMAKSHGTSFTQSNERSGYANQAG
jgi:hypothetical protein